MSDDTNAFWLAWQQAKRDKADSDQRVGRLANELEVARVEAAKIDRVEEALRVWLGTQAAEVVVNDAEPASEQEQAGDEERDAVAQTAVSAVVSRPALAEAGLVPTGGEPARKHVRSGSLVVQAVSAGGGVPVHREEVLAYFEREGATAGMKNPRNAVNAALKRAVNDHQTLFQITPDTFVVRSADAFMSPEVMAADRLRENAEESS